MTDDVMELRFEVDDGIDLAKILSELESYARIERSLSLPLVLSRQLKSTGVVVQFRRPRGQQIAVNTPTGTTTKAELLRALMRLEEQVPDAAGYLGPDSVYWDPDDGRTTFAAVLLGWHAKPPRVFENLESWRTLLGLKAPSDLRSFGELFGEFLRSGQAGPDAKQDAALRAEALRRRALNLVTEQPYDAAVLLREALQLRPGVDVLGEALDAARQAADAALFEDVLATGRCAGIPADHHDLDSLHAWHRVAIGRSVEARELANRARLRGSRWDLALDVLIQTDLSENRFEEAGAHLTELLSRAPSAARWRRAMGLAWKRKDFVLGRRLLDACRLTLDDALSLLFRALVELSERKSDQALATLMNLAVSGDDLTEEICRSAIEAAESALRGSTKSALVERMLPLIGELRRSRPSSAVVALKRATYLLAANLNAEAETALTEVPNGPAKDRLAATLAFRGGDYARATMLGLRAVAGDSVDAELVETLVEACRCGRMSSTLEEVARAAPEFFRAYDELSRLLAAARRELLHAR